MVEENNIDEVVNLTNKINKLKFDLHAIKKVKTLYSIFVGTNYLIGNSYCGIFAQRDMFAQYIDIDTIKYRVKYRINNKLKNTIEQRDKLIK